MFLILYNAQKLKKEIRNLIFKMQNYADLCQILICIIFLS